MKTILSVFFSVLVVSGVVYGAGYLQKESGSKGQAVQQFAPNGSKVTALTVNSVTTDMSSDVQYQVISGSGTTCYLRLMPTSAKGAYSQVKFGTAQTIQTYAVSGATPFANLSGCTAGYLIRQ